MGLNVERFMKVKQLILEEPARMDMGRWKDTNMEEREIVPACRTVGCICGWAAISARMDKEGLKRPLTAAKKISIWTIEDEGAHALGMGSRDSRDLFRQDNWPDDLRTALDDHEVGTPAYAAIVAQAIDRYVACDGNWSNDKGAA